MPKHETQQPRRWSDWSRIQRWRRLGKEHDGILRERKINRLRAEKGISRSEACRQLEHNDDVEVPDHLVDGRPTALQPEVSAGD